MKKEASTELLRKIVRTEAAMKAGKLDDYVVAKSATDSVPSTPSSWGPAMRI
jgi:hypothetical protein